MRTCVPVGVGVKYPGDDALQAHGAPTVGESRVRLDQEDFTVDDSAPVGDGRGAEAETMVYGGLEIIFHQPLLDESALGEGAPDFLRGMRHVAFDDEGACLGRRLGGCLGERLGGCLGRRLCRVGHLSILFSRFSSWSNRSRQNAPYWLIQSTRGARACGCAL